MISTVRGASAAVGAKAHARYSYLLRDADYLGLLNLTNVEYIADRLRTMPGYRDHMKAVAVGEARRRDIEKALRGVLLSEVESFMWYLNGPRADFLTSWVSFYEAENLKMIFRWLSASGNQNREHLRERLFPVPHSRVNFEALLGAQNFAAVRDILQPTRFGKAVIAPIERLLEGEKSLLSLEMAVDSLAEEDLFHALERLDKDEKKYLLPIFGSRIDLGSLYILFRSIKYYRIPTAEALNRLLHVSYKIPMPTLMRLGQHETAEAMVEALDLERGLQFAKYAPVFRDAIADEEPEMALERNIKRFTYVEAQRALRAGQLGFHTAMAYFVLRQYEIEDIIRIVEYVRYDVDRNKAISFLIKPIRLGGGVSWQS